MSTPRRNPDRARPRADVASARPTGLRPWAGCACRARGAARRAERQPRLPSPKRASCASPRSTGATSPRTSTRASPAACRARARRRCPAWAMSAPSGCSSARRPAPRKTRRASPSSDRPEDCSTTCWRRSGMKRGENVYIANVLKCRPPEQPHARAGRSRCLPPVPRPADRAHRAQGDRRAGQERRDHAPRRSTRRSRACAGASTATAAFRSSSRIIRPTCCATCPTRQKAWEDLLFARRTLRGCRMPPRRRAH